MQLIMNIMDFEYVSMDLQNWISRLQLIGSCLLAALFCGCGCYMKEEICEIALSCDNIINCEYVSDHMSLHGEFVLIEEYLLNELGAKNVKDHIFSNMESNGWKEARSVSEYQHEMCTGIILNGYQHDADFVKMINRVEKSIVSKNCYVKIICNEYNSKAKIYIFSMTYNVIYVAEYNI